MLLFTIRKNKKEIFTFRKRTFYLLISFHFKYISSSSLSKCSEDMKLSIRINRYNIDKKFLDFIQYFEREREELHTG